MISRLLAFLCRIVFLTACGLFALGVVLIGVRFPAAVLIVAAFMAWRRMRRGSGSGWSHGQAKFTSLHEAERGGLLADDGLILGRCLPEKPSKLRGGACPALAARRQRNRLPDVPRRLSSASDGTPIV